MTSKKLTDELELHKRPHERKDARARKLRVSADAAEGVLENVLVLVTDVRRFRQEITSLSSFRSWSIVESRTTSVAQFQATKRGELTLFENELPGPLAVGAMTLEEAAELANCQSVEQIETSSRYKPD